MAVFKFGMYMVHNQTNLPNSLIGSRILDGHWVRVNNKYIPPPLDPS